MYLTNIGQAIKSQHNYFFLFQVILGLICSSKLCLRCLSFDDVDQINNVKNDTMIHFREALFEDVTGFIGSQQFYKAELQRNLRHALYAFLILLFLSEFTDL